jgi:hypothetical protein
MRLYEIEAQLCKEMLSSSRLCRVGCGFFYPLRCGMSHRVKHFLNIFSFGTKINLFHADTAQIRNFP